MKKWTIVPIITMVIIIGALLMNTFAGGLLRGLYRDYEYNKKANAAYVESHYDVEVVEHYKVFKSFTFECIGQSNDKPLYIIYDYSSKSFFEFSSHIGRDRDDILTLVNSNKKDFDGYDGIELYLDNNTGVPTVFDLKWHVYNSETAESVDIDFIDSN